MQKLNIYATLNKDSKMLANIGIGSSDQEYCKFFLNRCDYILKRAKEEKQDLDLVLDNIRNNFIVRVGSIDLESYQLNNDFSNLADLSGFGLADKENIKEGE